MRFPFGTRQSRNLFIGAFGAGNRPLFGAGPSSIGHKSSTAILTIRVDREK
jgi:hypothetical protein